MRFYALFFINERKNRGTLRTLRYPLLCTETVVFSNYMHSVQNIILSYRRYVYPWHRVLSLRAYRFPIEIHLLEVLSSRVLPVDCLHIWDYLSIYWILIGETVCCVYVRWILLCRFDVRCVEMVWTAIWFYDETLIQGALPWMIDESSVLYGVDYMSFDRVHRYRISRTWVYVWRMLVSRMISSCPIRLCVCCSVCWGRMRFVGSSEIVDDRSDRIVVRTCSFPWRCVWLSWSLRAACLDWAWPFHDRRVHLDVRVVSDRTRTAVCTYYLSRCWVFDSVETRYSPYRCCRSPLMIPWFVCAAFENSCMTACCTSAYIRMVQVEDFAIVSRESCTIRVIEVSPFQCLWRSPPSTLHQIDRTRRCVSFDSTYRDHTNSTVRDNPVQYMRPALRPDFLFSCRQSSSTDDTLDRFFQACQYRRYCLFFSPSY